MCVLCCILFYSVFFLIIVPLLSFIIITTTTTTRIQTNWIGLVLFGSNRIVLLWWERQRVDIITAVVAVGCGVIVAVVAVAVANMLLPDARILEILVLLLLQYEYGGTRIQRTGSVRRVRLG